MKKILYILILIVSITLCGCWGHIDMNDLNILYGVGVDLNRDNEYVFVTESISPIGNKDETQKTSPLNFYTSKGESIFEAARNLTKTASGKRTFYQTCQVIGVGENLCETSLTPIIDFFTRDSKRRSTSYLVIVDGNAPDFFIKNSNSSQPLSTQLVDIIKLYKYTGYAVNMNLAQTITKSKSVDGTVLLNKFKLNPSEKGQNKVEPVLDGSGVFYKNKLIGFLNSQETMAANIVSKQIKQTTLVVNKDNNETPYYNTTVEFSNLKIKFNPIVENDKYVMNMDIYAKASIVEYTEKESFKNYNYNELENLISESLKKLIYSTYVKSKNELKVDALGFGKYFSQKNKSISNMTTEGWNNVFCNKFSLNLNVKTNIINTGCTLEKSD